MILIKYHRIKMGVGLRSLACWDCGFESRCGYGCLYVVNVASIQVEASAMGQSLVQEVLQNVCHLVCQLQQ
jgi:hypothetical protein